MVLGREAPSNAGSTSAKPKELCQTFREVAIRTWDYLRDSSDTKLRFGEETLTDINLLEIQRNHPKEVKVHKFSKLVEGSQTGADWEWWLGCRNEMKWLALRVQAKKLNPKSLTYREINRPKNTDGQLQMLVNSAAKIDAVPMYCFYNYLPSERSRVKTKCAACELPAELFGCTMASARFVASVEKRWRNQLRELANGMLPWHCLVCCKRYSLPGADLVDRAIGVLVTLWGMNRDSIRVREEPFAYVRSILHGEPVLEPPTGVPYVLVTTERESM